jgi:serine/threonine protein kinase
MHAQTYFYSVFRAAFAILRLFTVTRYKTVPYVGICLTSCLPRSIMEGKFSFTSTEWRDVTTAPKDLISRILVVDYRQRPTVQQCLSHEFFRESRRDSMNEVAEPFQSRRLFRRVELGDMQRFR